MSSVRGGQSRGAWLPRAALVLALLWAVPLARSAEDPGAVAKAKELIERTGAEAIASQMMQLSLQQMKRLLNQLNPEHGPAIEELLVVYLIPGLEERLPELTGLSAQLYARHFTAEELEELSAFYDTPLGQKTIRVMPQLMQQSALLGQVWAQRVTEDLLRELIPELKKRGLKAPDI